MKCPLSFTYVRLSTGEWRREATKCLKDGCAWWFDRDGACAMLATAQAGFYLQKALLEIKIHMPHAGQFTK